MGWVSTEATQRNARRTIKSTTKEQQQAEQKVTELKPIPSRLLRIQPYGYRLRIEVLNESGEYDSSEEESRQSWQS